MMCLTRLNSMIVGAFIKKVDLDLSLTRIISHFSKNTQPPISVDIIITAYKCSK
jgi:hypothetical protein